jgi:hypothetical protein
MDDTRPPGPIEGADDAALGTNPPPTGAPPGAEVSDAEHLVPGADFGEGAPSEAKPWAGSFAARSTQAGVANDGPAAQEPQFPEADDEAVDRT